MTKSMDMSSSQCTSGSGCESGWTLYLEDQHYHYQRSHGSLATEDDLSMLSDASSGPPPQHHSFHGNASGLAQSSNIKKINDESCGTERHSCLDDTASSPVFTFPKKNMSFSNKKPSMEHVSSVGFSATHFKGKSAVQKHFGFFQSEKPTSQSQDLGGFQGRKWK